MSASWTKKRRNIKQAIQREILARDKYTCQYCGAMPGDTSLLDIDHIIPQSLGGHDRCDNLVTACRSCNRRAKNNPSAKPLTDHIKSLIARERKIIQDLRAIKYAVNSIRITDYMTSSIRNYLRRGLTRGQIIRALTIANKQNCKNKGHYFHGICRSMISETTS